MRTRSFSIPLLIIILLIVSFVMLVESVSSVDIVKIGSAYGFEIGKSKEAVFERLLEENIQDKYAYISVFIPEAVNYHELNIELKNKMHIMPLDVWSVRLQSRIPIDNIRLVFEEDTLAVIYRRRDFFEVP